MSRSPILFNVFKPYGLKNRKRNESVSICSWEYPGGAPVTDSFEEYMNQVEANPNLFNFQPILIEISGLMQDEFPMDICKKLASVSCSILNPLLDGETVIMKKNTFSVISLKRFFPDKESARQCAKRIMKNQSLYVHISPMLDETLPLESFIHEDSVRVQNYTQDSHSDIVRFQIIFDLDVRLTQPVQEIELKKLKKPYSVLEKKDFYSLAKTLNNHLDQFYFLDDFNRLIYKNETEMESDATFKLEFRRYLGRLSIWAFVKILHSALPPGEWRQKLDFWVDPSKYGFKTRNYEPTEYVYEVPNRTCVNAVTFRIDLGVTKSSMQHLLKFCNKLEEETIKMIGSRMPFIISENHAILIARIRDVRTIQAMQEHCLYIYNGVKAFYDFVVQEIFPQGDDIIDYLANLVLTNVKCDPLGFVESNCPVIKKMATAWVNGSFYGE